MSSSMREGGLGQRGAIPSFLPTPSTGAVVGAAAVPMAAPAAGPATAATDALHQDLFRYRNKKKDQALRKKVEGELSRKSKRSSVSFANSSGGGGMKNSISKQKAAANTVASLRPVQAITVYETANVSQIANLMAAKRADAVLAVDREGQLTGILTDKDIAYRVIAEGLDYRSTPVSQVMTRNPISVNATSPRGEALSIMCSSRFRHLPVISGEDDEDIDDASSTSNTHHSSSILGRSSTNVVGLLDITKCVFDRLDDLEKKVMEDANIVAAMDALDRRGTLESGAVAAMKANMGCPDLNSVMSTANVALPIISPKSTVREAAKLMKQAHHTATLVSAISTSNDDEKLGGILTTKDIVLRVIAAGLDPNTTSIVRVMTPHPDYVDPSTTILEALKKLHGGHYLHLPVVEVGVPVALMDVLTLTMAMLEYLVAKDIKEPNNNLGSAPIDTGPVWNRFWNSAFAAKDAYTEESESLISEDATSRPSIAKSLPQQVEVLPAPRAPSSPSPQDSIPQSNTFVFKFRDPKSPSKVFRFVSSSSRLSELQEHLHAKLGSKPVSMGYEDDEGDLINLACDDDLVEAVALARKCGWQKISIVVGPGNAARAADSTSIASNFSAAQSSSTWGNGAPAAPAQRTLANDIAEAIRESPLIFNVGVSAAIVVVAAFIVSRVQRL